MVLKPHHLLLGNAAIHELGRWVFLHGAETHGGRSSATTIHDLTLNDFNTMHYLKVLCSVVT